MRPLPLHRRLAGLLALTALLAFISGAGIEGPGPVIAAIVFIISLWWRPDARLARVIEPVFRLAAIVLAVRAGYYAVLGPADVVLPMVDLLLLLLCAEVLRRRGTISDARLYSLSFALLVAAAAYRPGVAFAVTFVAYVVLMTLSLAVGHVARESQRFRTRAPGLSRGALARVAAVSLIVLFVSGAVFVAFPRVSHGWMTREATLYSLMVGFGNEVSLAAHGATLEANPRVVLRIEFPRGRPRDMAHLHWRGRSYDWFDGVSWHRTRSPSLASRRAPSWPTDTLEQRIYAVPLEASVLFGVNPVISIRPNSRIQPVRDNHGDYVYLGRATPAYTVLSGTGPLPEAALRAAPHEVPRALRPFLQVPPVSARVSRLADSLTAGAANDYDRALAIQHWLRTTFRYTRELPRTAREATLEYFLFERREGHCEYFSTAMAVLLRTLGIATRNVNGFLGGDWNEFGNFLTVTQNRAHSWVEVWFDGIGWITFDPTPAGSGPVDEPAGAFIAPLRRMLDGFEHRWSKWVLEYDLDTQSDLWRRATEPFSRPAEPVAPSAPAPAPDVFGWLLVLLALVAIVLAVRARGRARFSPASALYLAVRRQYQRCGFAGERTPPLAFLDDLRAAGAPGIVDAELATALYLRLRFAAGPVPAGALADLSAAAARIRRTVRRRRT